MEVSEKIVKYIERTLITFSILVLLFSLLNFFFDENVSKISLLFEFVKNALSLKLIFQLFIFSFVVNAITFFMGSDFMIKRMGRALRLVLMFILIFISLAVMIVLCHWFPPQETLPWLLTAIGFVLSFTMTVVIDSLKERHENEKINDALNKYIKK